MASATADIFESDAAFLGNAKHQRATETAHRKIELQSPADLSYLVANVSRAAREKLDKRFPPDAPQPQEGKGKADDKLRLKVEALTYQYIHDTFHAAKDNISINGVDSRELDAELAKAEEGEELEPFDAALAQRIQHLAAQVEQHTLHLANLRRTAPEDSATRFASAFEKHSEHLDQRLSAGADAQMRAAAMTQVDPAATAAATALPPDRVAETHRTYRQGADDLGALKAGLGDTVARLERAKKAMEVLDER